MLYQKHDSLSLGYWQQNKSERVNRGRLPKTVSIIEEEVLGLHVSEVELGALSSEHDLIPQNHLVQGLEESTTRRS